jgi:hypothetical protein
MYVRTKTGQDEQYGQTKDMRKLNKLNQLEIWATVGMLKKRTS